MLEALSFSEAAKIVVPGLIAFFSGRYLSNYSRNLTSYKEQFEKLYLPIYTILKPYLYKTVEDKRELLIIMKKINSLVQENSHLVPEDMIDDLNILINNIKSGNEYLNLFDAICFDFERRYHKLRSCLRYPKSKNLGFYIRNISLRRIKARLNYLDNLLGEFVFITALVVLFILISQFAYNILMDIYKLVIR